MKKLLSFTINDTYPNARKIADGFIIILMRYPLRMESPAPTYASTVKQTLSSRWHWALCETQYITDDDVADYKITIYQVKGNRGSIISPSQNQVFLDIITSDELLDIVEDYHQKGYTGKNNDNTGGGTDDIEQGSK